MTHDCCFQYVDYHFSWRAVRVPVITVDNDFGDELPALLFLGMSPWFLPGVVPFLTIHVPGGGIAPMYAMDEQSSRPFVWFPLAGNRHAIDRKDQQVTVGELMRCLCGAAHPRGAEGNMEWLWPTCEGCWEEACRVVGIRPVR